MKIVRAAIIEIMTTAVVTTADATTTTALATTTTRQDGGCVVSLAPGARITAQHWKQQ